MLDSPSSAAEDSQDYNESTLSQDSLSRRFTPSPCSSRDSLSTTSLVTSRPGTPFYMQAGQKSTSVQHNRPKTPVGPPINTRVAAPRHVEPSQDFLDLEYLEEHLSQAEAELQQILTSHTQPLDPSASWTPVTHPSASSARLTQPSTSSTPLTQPSTSSTRLTQQPSTPSARLTQQPHTHTRKKQKKDDRDNDEMFTEISTRLLDRLEKKGSTELKYASYGKHIAQQLGTLDGDIADDIMQIIDTALYNGKKQQRERR